MDLGYLKSGTDIRGVACEGVAGEHIELTDEAVECITAAAAVWLSEQMNISTEKLKISVGHDSRISAQRIKTTVIGTLSKAGVYVVDCGLSSTPAMFMTTVKLGCDAAIQITASHHPFNRNGLKFFTRSGGVSGGDISKILSYTQSGVKPLPANGRVEQYDFMKDYARILREMIQKEAGGEKPLEGLKIAVDAGNGAGGFYAYDVLEPLGADISGSQFLEPDGMFPNHVPNPEDKSAMESICAATVASGSDLGVIFDTDVDRASCVGADGRDISRNRIVALAAAIALEDCPGGTIVTDSVTSSGLKIFIEQRLGGKHHRFKRGYKNVIDESIRLNGEKIKSPLAIETSGHAAFADNYFLDDGAYLVTKIIIKAAQLARLNKRVESLIDGLSEPAEEAVFRFAIKDADFRACGERVLKGLEEFSRSKGWAIADDNREGLRVSLRSGWFLLRLSVHDPIMPFNIEADVPGDAKLIAADVFEYLRGCGELDTHTLEQFIG